MILLTGGGCVSAPQGGGPGGVSGPRGDWSWGGVCSGVGGAWWRPPGTATAAGGMHPTGMHSCRLILFNCPV